MKLLLYYNEVLPLRNVLLGQNHHDLKLVSGVHMILQWGGE